MERLNAENEAIPNAEDECCTAAKGDTAPEAAEELFIPVKFNKEVRNLSPEDAGVLAQKGLKFEAIKHDYETLKALAADSGRSVSEFLNAVKSDMQENRKKELAEKCGGNSEMAEYVLKLENRSENDNGFSEIKAEFPEISDISQLPESVVENARLKGTMLLDEYLRYRRAAERAAAQTAAENRRAAKMSLGSQSDRRGGINPETAEFLKGLWK